MQKKTFIIANWKMNLNEKDAHKLIKDLAKLAIIKKKSTEVIICPQFLLLPGLSKLVNSSIFLGAQDCHYQIKGAYTGDNSIELIKFFRCKYVILGHSERRKFHNEKNSLVKNKVDTVRNQNLIPILCVGESLEERKKNTHKKKIIWQLENCISKNIDEIVIAYEPVWSIGTGITPTEDEISEISDLIFNYLINSRKKLRFSIVYGGSVDSENFKKLIEIKHINGALIGGASLKFDELSKIINSLN